MNQNHETLGRYLIRERQLRRVSVEEIALRVNTERRFIDALEQDDFDIFDRRSEAAAVLTRYTDYLNMDRAEVWRRFAAQWKLTGGVKRYPKLTHFIDGDSSAGHSVAFHGKRLLAGHSWLRRGRLPLFIGVLVVGLVIFFTLSQTPREITPGTSVLRDTVRAIPPVTGSSDHASLPAMGRNSTAPIAVSAPPVSLVPTGGSGVKPVPSTKTARIVGNRDSKRYHLPGMKYYDTVKTYHRVIFQSEREAINAGYTKGRE